MTSKNVSRYYHMSKKEWSEPERMWSSIVANNKIQTIKQKLEFWKTHICHHEFCSMIQHLKNLYNSMITVFSKWPVLYAIWNDVQVKDLLKIKYLTLAGVVQWTECWPMNQRVSGSIPNQGTDLGCRPGPQLWACKRQPHMAVSLPLFLPLFPSP